MARGDHLVCQTDFLVRYVPACLKYFPACATAAIRMLLTLFMAVCLVPSSIWHHGIDIGEDEQGETQVIHLDRNMGVVKTSRSQFSGGQLVYKLCFREGLHHDKEETACKAVEHLTGNRATYNMVLRNCETFAAACSIPNFPFPSFQIWGFLALTYTWNCLHQLGMWSTENVWNIMFVLQCLRVSKLSWEVGYGYIAKVELHEDSTGSGEVIQGASGWWSTAQLLYTRATELPAAFHLSLLGQMRLTVVLELCAHLLVAFFFVLPRCHIFHAHGLGDPCNFACQLLSDFQPMMWCKQCCFLLMLAMFAKLRPLQYNLQFAAITSPRWHRYSWCVGCIVYQGWAWVVKGRGILLWLCKHPLPTTLGVWNIACHVSLRFRLPVWFLVKEAMLDSGYPTVTALYAGILAQFAFRILTWSTTQHILPWLPIVNDLVAMQNMLYGGEAAAGGYALLAYLINFVYRYRQLQQGLHGWIHRHTVF